ncbi:hypothetical protein VTO42DRAFT_6346 [Malbranchea cinnamomea]
MHSLNIYSQLVFLSICGFLKSKPDFHSIVCTSVNTQLFQEMYIGIVTNSRNRHLNSNYTLLGSALAKESQ